MNTGKYEVCGMDGQLRVTLKDLQSSISRLIKDKQVSESATILWAKAVTADDEYGAAPGSVLLGLEWVDNGEIEHGTMRIEPPLVGSKYIN